MYEMQTLIPTTQIVMTNGTIGNGGPVGIETVQNGGIIENQKILRTSTPTDDSVDQMCIELPPIKCNSGAAIEIPIAKASNGFLETFSSKQPSTTEHKDLKNGSLKAISSLSPYKCFQVSTTNLRTQLNTFRWAFCNLIIFSSFLN